MRFLGFLTLASMVLSGCVQTMDDHLANTEANLNRAYANRPLSEFINRNNLLPQNRFDTEGQQVFVFGPPCASWWYTKALPNGKDGPENFIVSRVKLTGYC